MLPPTATPLTSLLQRASLTDHDECLRAANEALKRSKIDVQAQQTKVIALLNLDRYEDALRVYDDAGYNLKTHVPLAWCYTLYKCGKLKEAMEAAEESHTNRGLMHVKAQTAYRSEDFRQASELYDNLARPSFRQDSEFNDLRINRSATNAQIALAGQVRPPQKFRVDREDLKQFETTFNAACAYIAQGDLKQAAILLSRARDLCNAADELYGDEKLAELLPIKVQQIYVLLRLDRIPEAHELCREIDIALIQDTTERYVAQANLLAVSSARSNPYLSQRLLAAVYSAQTKNQPFECQASVLKRNILILDLLVGKLRSVATSTKAISEKLQNPDISSSATSAGVLHAAASALNQTGRAALRRISPLAQIRPLDVGLLLTIIQLYVTMEDYSSATSVLESFLAKLNVSTLPAMLETRFSPGLVALMVALYGKVNRTCQSEVELTRAAQYWKEKSNKSPTPAYLFNETGLTLLNSPSAEEVRLANELFGYVHSQNPDDWTAIAGLAASVVDVRTMPKAFEDKLQEVSKLVAGIDVERLEKSGVARSMAIPVGNDTKKRSVHGDEGRDGKVKKTRRGKPPKLLDPTKPPDPERWLPLKDRSNWKPKGGRKRVRAGMSTQGGVVSEESRPVTPSSQVLQQAKLGPPKARKKKSKGGK